MNESAVKKEVTEDMIKEETDPLAEAPAAGLILDDNKDAIKDEIEIDHNYLND